jgi:thiol-disulfide isomerase/thioredoxin
MWRVKVGGQATQYEKHAVLCVTAHSCPMFSRIIRVGGAAVFFPNMITSRERRSSDSAEIGGARTLRVVLSMARIGAIWACLPVVLAAAPAATSEPVATLVRGDVVAPFELEGVDGVSRRVEFAKGQVTVLLFFSSGCPACHEMLPAWNRAFARRPRNMAVIGVIIDTPPPHFFERVAVAFPVLRASGRAFLDQLKVARVPITVRVAPGGKVEDVGVGPLDVIRTGQLFRP